MTVRNRSCYFDILIHKIIYLHTDSLTAVDLIFDQETYFVLIITAAVWQADTKLTFNKNVNMN